MPVTPLNLLPITGRYAFLAITLFLYLSLISGYPQGNPQNNQGFLMGKKISRRDGTESFFGHLVDRAGKRWVYHVLKIFIEKND